MSCTVKISSSNKNWSGPAPRRINSLAEEASSSSTSSSANYQTASNSTSLSKSCSAPQRGVKSIAAKKGEDTSKLLKYIDDSIIGKSATFFGPFGRRKGELKNFGCFTYYILFFFFFFLLLNCLEGP